MLDFANKYVREMALRRKRFIELISVAEGEEAIDFTRHFHTWVTYIHTTPQHHTHSLSPTQLAKDPFLDPILAREEKYADLLFQEYKKKEQEEKRSKEKRAMHRYVHFVITFFEEKKKNHSFLLFIVTRSCLCCA